MDNDTTKVAGRQEQLTFEGLIGVAEAVVAVEILSTDYADCARDGPMVATAKVLKALKGPYTTGKQISFVEGAWIGPSYREGEYRILFLDKPKPSELPTTSLWRLGPGPRMICFIERDSVPALSEESLRSFLKEIQEYGEYPGKVVFDKRLTGWRYFFRYFSM